MHTEPLRYNYISISHISYDTLEIEWSLEQDVTQLADNLI